MSAIHELCRFEVRPVEEDLLEALRAYLRAGVPATYTVEEAERVLAEEAAAESTANVATMDEVNSSPGDTTPLHVICSNVPTDLSAQELKVVLQMVETLFEYGAGWSLVDPGANTPGCILNKRGLQESQLYQQIVEAGVRAELLLRKIENGGIEFIDDMGEVSEGDIAANDVTEENVNEPLTNDHNGPVNIVSQSADPAGDQQTYLKSKLHYDEDSLLTDQKDGVMMSWETELMQLGCNSIFSTAEDLPVVLNIGFGMGIIDTMIQAKKPHKHYICEAHPDVLAKMRADGWYEKPNVVVLEGRWQEKLSDILSAGGVYFDGMYYDTFSEHYEDMLELFDFVVGLLKPTGTFSFFNGLGADRKVVYDVYKTLVPLDLGDYGLQCQFTEVSVPEKTLTNKQDGTSVWEQVKRSYWSCPVYYHPVIRFID